MSTQTAVKLVLPLPDSPNRWPSHPMAEHRAKNEYRRAAWVRLLMQGKPPRDPPQFVKVRATFYLPRRRDEDNLAASLKWPCDTIKQDNGNDSLTWRQGVATECGWLVDDSPEHMELVAVEQVTDRENPRLELELTTTEQEG